MKRLLLLLLVPSLLFAQKWDSTKTTDTPRSGMYKFNDGIKNYIAGKKIDTTGMSAMTNPIFVMQGDTMWVAKEGTIDSSTSGNMVYKSSSGTISNVGGMYVPAGLLEGATQDNTSKIQAAITAAAATGGTVLIPEGAFRVKTMTKTTATDVPNIFLYLTSGNVSIKGMGRGTTKIYSDSVGCLLYVGNVDSGATPPALSGIRIEGITFEYSGGFKQADSSYGWGVFVAGDAATIRGCAFRNFLNGLYIRSTSTDVVVDDNLFEWDHGRASVAFPSNESEGGFLYPTVGLRNYGVRSRITNNMVNCCVDTNFSTATGSPPDSMKVPADGFIHGTALGGLITNNTILRFAYEGIYVEDGTSTLDSVRKTIVSNNFVDGTMPGFIGHTSNMSHIAGEGMMGGWGIRVDGGNSVISGNVIVSAWQGILTSSLFSTNYSNNTIAGNTILHCPVGMYLPKLQNSTVVGNTVGSFSPSDSMRTLGLVQLYGIALADATNTKNNVVIGNNVQGSLTGWYATSTKATGTNATGQYKITCTSTANVDSGDYVRVNYVTNGSAIGQVYLVDTVETGYVVVRDTLTEAVTSSDTLFFSSTFVSGAAIADLSYGSNTFQANTTFNSTYAFFGYTTGQDVVLSTVANTSAGGVATDGITGASGSQEVLGNLEVDGALLGYGDLYSRRITSANATVFVQNTDKGVTLSVSNAGSIRLNRTDSLGVYQNGILRYDSSATATLQIQVPVQCDAAFTLSGTKIDSAVVVADTLKFKVGVNWYKAVK